MIIKVEKKDLKIRTYKSSGPGGQHRNTTETAIEIIHTPTGIKACSALKSQALNRKMALRILLARLQAYFTTPPERYNAPPVRVRTYHKPDNRVIDHASGLRLSWDEIVEKGDLSRMIESRAKAMIMASGSAGLAGLTGGNI